MTVYELIQELVQHDADKEVVIDFTTKDQNIELENDYNEGDEVVVTGEEKTGTEIGITTYRYDGYKVHIVVEED